MSEPGAPRLLHPEVPPEDRRLRALLDSDLLGVIRGVGEEILEANEAFAHMLGYAPDRPLRWRAITPPRWAAVDERAYERLMTDGRFEPIEKEYVARDGRLVAVLVGGTLLDRATGEWLCFVADRTALREAERERERLHEHTVRMQRVTERLSAALTAEEVAEAVVTETMAATGARCGVLALLRGDELHVDHRFGLIEGPPGRLPVGLQAPMPLAVRERRPVLVGSREEWLARWPDVPPRSDFEAFAAVPLVFEDAPRGCMGLGFPAPRPFVAADVALLEALAHHAVQALERGRLYEERARVARTLQEGLLPGALPTIPGLDVALRYRPIGDGSQVGGDFYDLVETRPGRALAAIGDICGKGVGAAVLSGVVRTAIGAVALHDEEPCAILSSVDELLVRRHAGALCSAALVSLTHAPAGMAVGAAAAGHPPPLVLRADGEVEVLDARGRLLGIGAGLHLDPSSALLRPGDLLLLYTDGVVDARRDGVTFGEQRLRATVAQCAGRRPSEVAAAVEEAVDAFEHGAARDDRAIMALGVTG